MGKKLNDLRDRVKRLELQVKELAKALESRTKKAGASKRRNAKAPVKPRTEKPSSSRGVSSTSKRAPHSTLSKAISPEKSSISLEPGSSVSPPE